MTTACELAEVLEKAKLYKHLADTHDPIYADLVIATDVVRKFIADNGLLIYGGTAIDMALRLKGDSIYPDDELPDLDFFSPKNVEHAYELADIFYKMGHEHARAINAMHMETMRVDVGDNHWIADISYKPPEWFGRIPYLEYASMRIVHPTFQRIDMHSALAFPYDEAPNEVVFARWSKDIKRFNKLAQHYPIDPAADYLDLTRAVVPLKQVRKYVYTGFLAFGFICLEFIRMYGAHPDKFPGPLSEIIAAPRLEVGSDTIKYNALNREVEIVHFDIGKAAEELALQDAKYYEPIISYLPRRAEGTLAAGKAPKMPCVIYDSNNKLLGVNTITVGGSAFRVANIHYVAKQFLGQYFVHLHDAPKAAGAYLNHYLCLVKMIKLLSAKTPVGDKAFYCSVFAPSTSTYGNDNVNLSRRVALSILYNELDGTPRLLAPRNYMPSRGGARPTFDPEESEIFHEDGREIRGVIH